MDDHAHEFEGDVQDGRVYCTRAGCRESRPITDREAVELIYGPVEWSAPAPPA